MFEMTTRASKQPNTHDDIGHFLHFITIAVSIFSCKTAKKQVFKLMGIHE